jgi:hypothetical protein
MPTLSDLFASDGAGRRGLNSNTGSNDPASLAQVRARGLSRSGLVTNSQLIDPALDIEWGKNYSGKRPPSSYYDYYYTGQDIIVQIDGVEGVDEFSSLPIISLAINITQQKPRIVQGEFSLATKTPDYMRRLLSAAAHTRATSGSTVPLRRQTDDESKIEQFWNSTIDPGRLAEGKNVFSVHPPFNMIIVYGIQSASLGSDYANNILDLVDKFGSDNPLYTDVNERLVESDNLNQANRFYLDTCEISAMQRTFSPSGDVCVETYSFFARDLVTPASDQ